MQKGNNHQCSGYESHACKTQIKFLCMTPHGNTIAAVFVPIGCLCQRISFSVSAGFALCPLSEACAGVSVRSPVQAALSALFGMVSVFSWPDIPMRQGHGCTAPQQPPPCGRLPWTPAHRDNRPLWAYRAVYPAFRIFPAPSALRNGYKFTLNLVKNLENTLFLACFVLFSILFRP